MNGDASTRRQVSNHGPRLSVMPLYTRDATLLIVGGELDVCTAPLFERVLLDVENGPRRTPMTLDLSRLQFIDVAGARAVWAARRRAEGAGRRLLCRYPTGPVRRIFDMLEPYAG